MITDDDIQAYCQICLNILHFSLSYSNIDSLQHHFQIVPDRSDRRLNHPRQNSEITKYMDAAWRLKEQTQNLS